MELIGLSTAELSALCERLGHPAFRGKQIADWIYRKGVRDLSRMSNIPAALREELARGCTFTHSVPRDKSQTPDGTTKFLLELSDGETVETVLIPYPRRTSVCVSTQVGCPVGCLFCATADCGFVRNLTAGEIVDQVLTLQEQSPARISHVVFMGMGEPLLNLDNVLKSISLLNDEIGIGVRRLTISTVGITPAIRGLRELRLQLTLAISLHAPDDELRRKLIPLAAKFPLGDLMRECREYAGFTGRRITFEYLLLAGVNDSPAQAENLAYLLRAMLANVNLIPYNEVPEKPYNRPSRAVVQAFRGTLLERGIEVTQRMERGHSIAAACGQLKTRGNGRSE